MRSRRWVSIALAALSVIGLAAPADASLVLSVAIIDFAPGQPAREDIEAWNNSAERMYLVAEPKEVVSPGLQDEHRVSAADPRTSGLIVTPQRLILEPGERRLIRISAIGTRAATDRIYRVAIRPVAGLVSGAQTGVKVMVGYDVLVILRPTAPRATIVGQRSNRTLTLTNTGNSNAELYEGKQCNASGADCRSLPAKRLYAGQALTVTLPFDTPVQYLMRAGGAVSPRQF